MPHKSWVVLGGTWLVAAAWLLDVHTQSALDVVWMWSGAMTATSVVVKARIRGETTDLHLLYDTDRLMQASRRFPLGKPVETTQAGVATFAVEGLVPNTRYFYTLEDGNQRTAIGEFRTAASGPMSFDFAAASCAGGNIFSAVSNSTIFTTIEDRRPLFFLHMGDFDYLNINRNDIQLFRRAYEQVLGQRRQASLYRHTPIAYMWDDHDYGPNDSDRTAPGREASRAAYAENVPHYPLTLEDGQVATIQQEFTIGRVRFIMTDLRSDRDPVEKPDGPDKTMLGLRQRAWFEAALTRASTDDVALLVWVSTVPYITHEGSHDDGWQPYAWERQWIADRLEALGLTRRMIMLAGDAHMTAIDDGTNSNYASTAKPGTPGFPVLQAGPLDRSPTVKGGPYSHGYSARNNQFGWIQVRDDNGELTVTLSGLDKGGRQLPGLRLRLTCRGGSCTTGE